MTQIGCARLPTCWVVDTFRSGSNALWGEYRPEELATPEAFDRDPALVTEWYLMRLA